MPPAESLPQRVRPELNTIADISAIIAATRGSAEGQEHIRNVALGLGYLKDNEHEYLYIPSSRFSIDAAVSSHANCLDYGQTFSNELPKRKPSGSQVDQLFIFHGFWSGSFNWRVELFIKSYLYTQIINPSHAQLWLWIDITSNPHALYEALSHPLALQFTHLIESGILSFLPWTLPARIPLPSDLDHSDGMGHVDNAERRSAYGFPDCSIIADSVMRDATGEEFLVTKAWAASMNPSLVSASDIVRFVVLHLHGGVYLDIDVLLLRDLRPLLLSGVDFAERWGAYSGKGDFNTAICAIKKMSSLSSFFLRQGVRLGLLFHPRILGCQLLKAGRVDELAMLESAAFDQVWPAASGHREGEIPTPSWNTFTQIFDGGFEDEKLGKRRDARELFKGAWAYHMHNQWSSVPEKGSWMEAVMESHNAFFSGEGNNGYGEVWVRKVLEDYRNMPQ